jgi:hypothetical protein
LKKDSSVETTLESLLKEETAGDPMSEQKWHRSSLRHLMDEMEKLGYSWKANEKRLAGSQHLDRNLQFAYIAAQKAAFRAQGLPIISVDTKKKELIGNFKNPGRNGVRLPGL